MNEGFSHTRAPLPKPKFLTGTPRWMEHGWGLVLLCILGLSSFGGIVRFVIEKLF